MSDLATQQQSLVRALFDWPNENAVRELMEATGGASRRGLRAYQTNGHMLAERTLSATYPVLVQLLGTESFSDLARAYWHQDPPLRGDLAQWGAGLADFLARSAQLADEPYLPDVARVEWELHCCATAPNANPDPGSLALLTTEDPSVLRLHLAPGCWGFHSAWPIADLLGAHVHGSPSLEAVGAQLREGVAQDTVVWRRGLRPEFRQALIGEVTLLALLAEGETLGHAVDASPTLDFAQWFPAAIQSKLILGAFVQPAPPTKVPDNAPERAKLPP